MTSKDEDRVAIRIGSDQYRYAERYTTTMGIFEQPSSCAMTIGGGDKVADLLARAPEETPIQVAVAEREQFTGTTDGYGGQGNAKRSTVQVRGKGILKTVVKSQIQKSQELNAPTYRGLIEKALADVNLKNPFTGDPIKILTSNAENRRIVTGQSSLAAEDVASDDALAQIAGVRGARWQTLRYKLGEHYFDLIKRKLDAAGLFPWESASGDLVVGVPTTNQPACAAIIRRRGRKHNVLEWDYRIDMTPRYSTCTVFGRTTGPRGSRSSFSGAASDTELLLRGLRWERIVRFRAATSVEQCAHIARKHIAEGRRAGFVFEYTVSRHTTESLLTPGARITWAPDIMVHVEDDEIGIKGDYWLERATHVRDDEGTRTRLRLYEPSMLVFGDGEGLGPSKKSSSRSSATPKTRTYFVTANTTLVQLSLELYADTAHADELRNLNPGLVQSPVHALAQDASPSEDYVAADTTIVYQPKT